MDKSSPTLTARQAEALRYIKETIATRGQAPSYRELAMYLGCQSVHGAKYLIDALISKKALAKPKTKARSLRVTERGQTAT